MSAAPGKFCPHQNYHHSSGPATGSLAGVIGPNEPCPTASYVEGNGKHGSQTPTGRTTLQINLCAFTPTLRIRRSASPNQQLECAELGLAAQHVELAAQYVEGFLAARAAPLWQRALGVKLGNLLNTESLLTRG